MRPSTQKSILNNYIIHLIEMMLCRSTLRCGDAVPHYICLWRCCAANHALAAHNIKAAAHSANSARRKRRCHIGFPQPSGGKGWLGGAFWGEYRGDITERIALAYDYFNLRSAPVLGAERVVPGGGGGAFRHPLLTRLLGNIVETKECCKKENGQKYHKKLRLPPYVFSLTSIHHHSIHNSLKSPEVIKGKNLPNFRKT